MSLKMRRTQLLQISGTLKAGFRISTEFGAVEPNHVLKVM